MEICHICGNSEDMCDSKVTERTMITDIPLPLCCECSCELELLVLETQENLNYCIAKERIWFLRECKNLTNHQVISDHLWQMEEATRRWMETRIAQTKMVLSIIKKLKSQKQ